MLSLDDLRKIDESAATMTAHGSALLGSAAEDDRALSVAAPGHSVRQSVHPANSARFRRALLELGDQLLSAYDR